MDREIIRRLTVRNLAFANMMDTIPLIRNVDDPVNPAILRIYERNAAVFNSFNHENVNLHQGEANIEE